MNVTVEEVSEKNIDEIRVLHDEWAEFKLNDPKTFKMMFPNKRYIYCCEKYLENKDKLIKAKYKTYVFRKDGKVIAVRVLGIQDDRVFDLANFGRVWDSFSQMMNYVDTWVLKDLHFVQFLFLY